MLLTIFIIVILGIGLFFLTFIIIQAFFGTKKIQYLVDLYDQQKYQMLIKAAKKLITKEPRNTAAHYLLGKAYMKEENFDMGLVEFKSVNAIGGFDENCQENDFRKEIAELYIKFNLPEEALKEYLLLLKLEPMLANNHYMVGFLFEERDRADMAITYYQKALELDPKHSNSHFRLGYILFRKKKYPEAKGEFENALKTDANNLNAHFYLGRIKKDGHDYSGALTHFEKAQKDPELKLKAIVERGACFMSMNNYEKAVSELTRALKMATDEGATETLYARFFLAHCYEKARKIEMAIEQWEKIYAKKPSFKNVAEKLSQYQELRQDDGVKDFLTSNKERFQEICEKIVKGGLKLQVRESAEIQNGCQIIAVESESKWRNARKMPCLIRFYRIPEMIKDTTIRVMHEDMKKLNVSRGIAFTSSSFSKFALEFAESRPIDLYSKDELRDFINKAYHPDSNDDKDSEKPK